MSVLRSAPSLDRVLADHHADTTPSLNAPGGTLVISRARHEGGELRAVVAGHAPVGEAESLLTWWLVGVDEGITQSVSLPGPGLGLHLEEAALLAILGLDLHVLPATVALQDQALLG